jgi:hypothetical protein
MNSNRIMAKPSFLAPRGRSRGRGSALGAAIVLIAAAGGAHAQTALPTLPPPRGEPIRPAIDLSVQRAALVRPYAQADAAGASLPRTAIDHRFALDRLVGSAGFLCGLRPGHTESGGAAAHGFDPQGRFLGAKLRFAFR